MCSSDLYSVQSAERLVSGLIDLGMGYEEIKGFLQDKLVKRLAA